MDATAKKLLLIECYKPVSFQGVIMKPNHTPVWLNSYKNKPFCLDISLDKHIESDGMNLAVVFPKKNTHIMAFDLDGDDILYSVIMSGYILIDVIKELGFNPIVYVSGGKGIHLEVRFKNEVSCDELKKLVKIIKTLAEERGCQYIDKIYPSGSAYRVFGCRHYKTNIFTGVIKTGSQSEQEPARILSEGDSWVEFNNYVAEGCRVNTIYKVEQALLKHKMMKVEIKNKQKKEPSPKGSVQEIQYPIKNLERIHEQGLYDNYTRYNTSYQLGIYFKEVLYLTEGQARIEIEQWLSRHYRTSSNYFGDVTGSKIKTPYNKCVKETIENCMRGWTNGKLNKPNQVLTFSKRKILKYVDDLKITKPQKVALRYLIRVATEYNSLTFYHSLSQLSKGFKISTRTVSLWIERFIELGVISIETKGKIINDVNIATTYKLIIPNNCYEIQNIDVVEIGTTIKDEVCNLLPIDNVSNVYCIKTNVYKKENEYRLEPIP